MSSPLILPLLAIVFGAALGWWVATLGSRASRAEERQAAALLAQQAEARSADHAARLAELRALQVEHAQVREAAEEVRLAHARIDAERTAALRRHQELESEVVRAQQEHRALRLEMSEARAQLARAAAELEQERAAAPEKVALLLGAREELTNQFKALANDILEEKSRRFTDHNRTSIEQILSPLRDKLGEFQLKVEALKDDGVAGRSELKTHIEGLRSLNERLSAEASNLVSALKGSSKTQGDWGEMLLERMLEDAGLRRGEEYRVQESFAREDGTRARPDVILNLPGERYLVIDAKVSLVDYNAYCACTDESSRETHLARHVASLREHIRGLARRNYQALYDLHSIDFVVMFVAIEPAYLLALAKDCRLWQEAWDNHVLLASPGTLFPIMRTVAQLWRHEAQNRNVQEIVYRGGELYDKLAAFAGDLSKVGDGLDAARTSYDKAMSKLRTGRGNAIRQAEILKSLGVKPSKQMPKEMLEALEDELVRTLVDETEGRASEARTDNLFE
ncbi:MAG TPA: DNA recombination protein RmuC [Acidobacteriaceae bacterium]